MSGLDLLSSCSIPSAIPLLQILRNLHCVGCTIGAGLSAAVKHQVCCCDLLQRQPCSASPVGNRPGAHLKAKVYRRLLARLHRHTCCNASLLHQPCKQIAMIASKFCRIQRPRSSRQCISLTTVSWSSWILSVKNFGKRVASGRALEF